MLQHLQHCNQVLVECLISICSARSERAACTTVLSLNVTALPQMHWGTGSPERGADVCCMDSLAHVARHLPPTSSCMAIQCAQTCNRAVYWHLLCLAAYAGCWVLTMRVSWYQCCIVPHAQSSDSRITVVGSCEMDAVLQLVWSALLTPGWVLGVLQLQRHLCQAGMTTACLS
jgi:hypothetical protein